MLWNNHIEKISDNLFYKNIYLSCDSQEMSEGSHKEKKYCFKLNRNGMSSGLNKTKILENGRYMFSIFFLTFKEEE